MTPTPPPVSADSTGYPMPVNREGKPVSFYVAIFLALLLLVSGALNLLLLVVSAFGSAAPGMGSTIVEEDGMMYQLVAAGGDRNAEYSVLRIPIEGAIAEQSSPFLGAVGGTVSQVRRALDTAAGEKAVRGILLDINSPGGGVTDSDVIWQMVRDFKDANPDTEIIALMGDMATSGGYYIAAACDWIIARPTTITGSIGVIMNSLNYGKGLEEIGVHAVTIKSPDTPYKDMLSPTRQMLPEEEAKLTAIVQELYERFLTVVDEGRPELDRDQVRALATGEIYSAEQAYDAGLVDDVGPIQDAYDQLAERIGVNSLQVVELRRVPGVFERLFMARTPSVDLGTAAAQLLRSSSGPKFLYYWPGGR